MKPQPLAMQIEADPSPSMADLAAQWSAAYDQAEQEFARLVTAERAAMELYPPRQPIQDKAAFYLWDKQTAAIASSFGIPGLDEAAQRTSKSAEDISKKILAMIAPTPQEVAIKYRVMLTMHGDGKDRIDDGAPFYSFLTEMQPVLERYQALADVACLIADIDDVQAKYAHARAAANV
ncbi:MAG: hypothetical protein CGW95_12565 [Phenylobacterium zucineum]|nr:MAG: hypothetical protein CGW95_12565 [Phenylobacterium zucineum]